MEGRELRVGGLQPLTTIDYPGCLAAVIFTQGCPWRCLYCHNRSLQPVIAEHSISWAKVLEFLKSRVGLLDAVVFSGGEPTAQGSITSAIAEVKKLGFKVGLHTAGIYPKRLTAMLPMLDWIGLDIKALSEDYAMITTVKNSGVSAWESAQIVLQSTVDYEMRITVNSLWMSERQLERIREKLMALGSSNTVVQAGARP